MGVGSSPAPWVRRAALRPPKAGASPPALEEPLAPAERLAARDELPVAYDEQPEVRSAPSERAKTEHRPRGPVAREVHRAGPQSRRLKRRRAALRHPSWERPPAAHSSRARRNQEDSDAGRAESAASDSAWRAAGAFREIRRLGPYRRVRSRARQCVRGSSSRAPPRGVLGLDERDVRTPRAARQRKDLGSAPMIGESKLVDLAH
jgi:hypothetical protein